MKQIVYNLPRVDPGVSPAAIDIHRMAPAEYARNLLILSDNVSRLALLAGYESSFSDKITHLHNFTPNYIDDLSEIILTGNESAFDLFVQTPNKTQDLSSVTIKDNSWRYKRGGNLTPVDSGYSFNVDHFLLAVLCNENTIALKLVENILPENDIILNYNIFEVLLIINSRLTYDLLSDLSEKDTRPKQFFAAACKLLSMMHDKDELVRCSQAGINLLPSISTKLPCIISKLSAASVNQKINDQDETILFDMCRNGMINICVKLIEQGADINHKNSSGQYPFDFFKLGDCLDCDKAEDFIELITLLYKKPNAQVTVSFLRNNSDIIYLLLGKNYIPLATKICLELPSLLSFAPESKNPLDCIPVSIIYYSAYIKSNYVQTLKPEFKTFLMLVRQVNPRIFLQLVMKDQKLIADFFGKEEFVKPFAEAHRCQDLLPPPSSFTLLYNYVSASSLSWFDGNNPSNIERSTVLSQNDPAVEPLISQDSGKKVTKLPVNNKTKRSTSFETSSQISNFLVTAPIVPTGPLQPQEPELTDTKEGKKRLVAA